MSAARAVTVEEYVASLPVDEQELAHHVLLGGFNEHSGRPVGFHHAPNGIAPPGRRIEKILRRYPDGSYGAVVAFWDPDRQRWLRKRGRHTMFPDHWSRDQVMAAGREAYLGRVDKIMKRWRSHGGGLPIGGYRRDDRRGAATFFPDHER